MEGVVALVFVVGVYFAPLGVATLRNHRQQAAIGVVNFFLGWTLIGWVVALAWACTSDTHPPRYQTY